LTYLGFITEGKLAAIFIKPSIGVSNWPVVYIINYTPTSFLTPFNTAPSATMALVHCFLLGGVTFEEAKLLMLS
jgi:hypothetical protein